MEGVLVEPGDRAYEQALERGEEHDQRGPQPPAEGDHQGQRERGEHRREADRGGGRGDRPADRPGDGHHREQAQSVDDDVVDGQPTGRPVQPGELLRRRGGRSSPARRRIPPGGPGAVVPGGRRRPAGEATPAEHRIRRAHLGHQDTTPSAARTQPGVQIATAVGFGRSCCPPHHLPRRPPCGSTKLINKVDRQSPVDRRARSTNPSEYRVERRERGPCP